MNDVGKGSSCCYYCFHLLDCNDRTNWEECKHRKGDEFQKGCGENDCGDFGKEVGDCLGSYMKSLG